MSFTSLPKSFSFTLKLNNSGDVKRIVFKCSTILLANFKFSSFSNITANVLKTSSQFRRTHSCLQTKVKYEKLHKDKTHFNNYLFTT